MGMTLGQWDYVEVNSHKLTVSTLTRQPCGESVLKYLVHYPEIPSSRAL